MRMRLSILGILPMEHAAVRSLCSLLLFLQQGSFPAPNTQPGRAFRRISSARAEGCTIPLGSASGFCLDSPVQQTGDLKIAVCLKERMLVGGVLFGSWLLLASGSLVLLISGLLGAHAGLVCISAWLLLPAFLTLGPR